ncbi:hypothetical protein Tco_0810967 [Tanacetum coccineum]
MGDENPIRTLGDYSKPSHEGYRNTIELPEGNNVVPLRSDTIQLVQNGCSFYGLRYEDPNQHLEDFLKLLAIGLNAFQQDPSPDGRILLPDSLLNSFHREDRKTPKRYPDVPTTSFQIFYDYVNPITRRTIDQLAGGKLRDLNAKESWALLEDLALYDNESWNDPSDFAKPVKAIALPQDVPSLNEGEGATTEEPVVEYFDTFPTRDELTYHRYLMSSPIPSMFLRNPIITEGCSYNLKIPGNIIHIHIEKAYIDLNSPLNIMTRMMYNWIMRRKLDPKGNANGGVGNFTRRIKGMHVFIGNFTYVVNFMIVEDISSIIDLRLSQVVLGRPFVEISNMTHDPPKGVVRFIRGADEVAYKMPHKIEQYESLLDLEK